jgi:hypothetical protein
MNIALAADLLRTFFGCQRQWAEDFAGQVGHRELEGIDKRTEKLVDRIC